ncbi:hypothetical protein JOD67_003677 [Tenggerimyces flavus]|nr:hypothetical protein [Tenggerimyces flavus]
MITAPPLELAGQWCAIRVVHSWRHFPYRNGVLRAIATW